MNRRAFVSGAFGGSLLAAAGTASAITTETSLDSVYNIRDYGATGDGLSPDHAPIQKALDAASKQGGIVFFPPGKYLLGATLYIDAPIILQGGGWHRNNPSLGTWFYIKDTESQVAFRSPDAQGAQLRDIAFFHDQPHGAPRDYKYAIHVMRDDVHISNVHLFNATNGILIKNNGVIGRVVLDHIAILNELRASFDFSMLSCVWYGTPFSGAYLCLRILLLRRLSPAIPMHGN